MKSILVPTDFSSCATDATEVAMKLAQKFKAKIHLYHQLDLPQDWESLSEEEKNARRETNQEVKNAEVLLQNIKDSYPDIETQSVVEGNSLLKGVNEYVAKHSIDFIVMGFLV